MVVEPPGEETCISSTLQKKKFSLVTFILFVSTLHLPMTFSLRKRDKSVSPFFSFLLKPREEKRATILSFTNSRLHFSHPLS